MQNIKDIIGALESLGFEVKEVSMSCVFGTEIVTAEKGTDRGLIEISWGTNDTAKVIKPNGSVKWLYEKSKAQIRRALVQTIEANTYPKH